MEKPRCKMCEAGSCDIDYLVTLLSLHAICLWLQWRTILGVLGLEAFCTIDLRRSVTISLWQFSTQSIFIILWLLFFRFHTIVFILWLFHMKRSGNFPHNFAFRWTGMGACYTINLCHAVTIHRRTGICNSGTISLPDELHRNFPPIRFFGILWLFHVHWHQQFRGCPLMRFTYALPVSIVVML